MSALVRRWMVMAIAIAAMPLVTGSVVSAQSTPESRRYGGTSQDYATQFSQVLEQLSAFWQGNFAGSSAPYRRPAVTPLDGPIRTGCGPASPQDFAFYCAWDETIYCAPAAFAAHVRRFGEFAPIVVIVYEWGHHVQFLLG